MHSYGAVEDYQQGKALETYLIVKHGIEKNCRENIKNVLLKKLDEAYQVGSDLMEVLQGTLEK